MHAIPSKISTDFFLRVSVKNFHHSESLGDFDNRHHLAPINLSGKSGEYMLRIGGSNDFCSNHIVQLLTERKARLDFRNIIGSIYLMKKLGRISQVETVKFINIGLRNVVGNQNSLNPSTKWFWKLQKKNSPSQDPDYGAQT